MAEEEFTIENQFLTSSGKLRRHAIALKFKDQLDPLIQQLLHTEIHLKLENIFQNVLEVRQNGNALASQNFISLGGDSLSAVRIISEIK